jgi:hypothetical protein
MSLNKSENNLNTTKHREWLDQVKGTRIPEITGARPMEGLESVPLEGLVVSNDLGDNYWARVKRALIPLKPALTEDDPAKKAARELHLLRTLIVSNNGFLALLPDDQLDSPNKWVLSIINPAELLLTEAELRESIGIGYASGQPTLGSSSRAALLAIMGSK